MKVNKKGQETILTLSSPLDSRPKVFFFIQAIFYGLAAMAILGLEINFSLEMIGIFILSIFVMLMLIISVRFLSAAIRGEMFIIRKGSFLLETKALFKRKAIEYKFDQVSGLSYIPRSANARHPLAGNTFDYLGFQTEQQVINKLHDDDRVAFFYKGRIVTFGRDLSSWHFDELVDILIESSGNDFTIRKEETNDYV